MEAHFCPKGYLFFGEGPIRLYFFKPDWLPAIGSSLNLITFFMEIFYTCIWYFTWNLYMKNFRGQVKVAVPGSKFYSAPLVTSLASKNIISWVVTK